MTSPPWVGHASLVELRELKGLNRSVGSELRGGSFFTVWDWRQKKGGQCGSLPLGTSGVHALVSAQSTWTQHEHRVSLGLVQSLTSFILVLLPTTHLSASSSNLLPLFKKKKEQQKTPCLVQFFSAACSFSHVSTFRVCFSYKAHVHIPQIKCKTQGCSVIRNNQNIQMVSPRFAASLHVWFSTQHLFSWLFRQFEITEEPRMNEALVNVLWLFF